MADYKELLRRAITALPENNGAARRAVYEKARSALVAQLRAIDPPLQPRDITQHRLQLEDCIRQVEQEASEAVISLSRESGLGLRPVASQPAPVVPPLPVAEAQVAKPVPTVVHREDPAPRPEPKPKPVHVEPENPAPATSIEDIISAAESATAPEPEPEAPKPEPAKPVLVDIRPEPVPVPELKFEPRGEPKPARPIPSIVARAEAAKSGPTSAVPPGGQRMPSREAAQLAANFSGELVRANARVEPSMSGQAAARQQVIAALPAIEDVPVEAALSSVREVEVETGDATEAEGAISRAIETLDREARGETVAVPANDQQAMERVLFAEASRPAPSADEDSDTSFAAAPAERRSGAGLTIFLVVFALLLAGAGGAGFWAWREGYVNLDQMFGRADTTVADTAVTPAQPTTPTLDTAQTPSATDEATGPGNTSTATVAEPTTALQGLEPTQERLSPTPETADTALPGPNDADKGEERLPGESTTTTAANDPATSVDPAVLAGSQSLLLEASDQGTTGAVPFSGTIEWSEGVDEIGLPTLIGHASIPARNLGIDLTIRKNSDPSLPASHLMEVSFKVSDSFVGGNIADLPGVLLKNQELVQGTPLAGASARIVQNSFLFALDASPNAAPANVALLTQRRWMDLAVIYGTGKRAIITLEKDEAAQALFNTVFAAWGPLPTPPAAAAPASAQLPATPAAGAPATATP